MSSYKLRLRDRFKRTKVYIPGTNKCQLKRLNWEQIEARPPKEDRKVVKGTSKRIVVVKSPDPKVFEQAIFIVREDFLGRGGRADALKEAQQVADNHIKRAVASPKRLLSRIRPAVWASAGGLFTAIISLAVYFLLI